MFIDRLIEAIIAKKNPMVMSLNPQLELIPNNIKEDEFNSYGENPEGAAHAILYFSQLLIDSVCDLIPVIKLPISCYEQFGWLGVWAMEQIIAHAQSKDMLVIIDGKRNDVNSYANTYLGAVKIGNETHHTFNADALTINGYLGTNSIKKLLKVCQKYDKGIFVLVKTSGHSAYELQNRLLDNGKTVYEEMAKLCAQWGESLPGEYGYSGVGAVIKITRSRQLTELREQYPNMFFLISDYGEQGINGVDITKAFNENGMGAMVDVSHPLMCAWQKTDNCKNYRGATRAAVIRIRDDITQRLNLQE